ncbi:hypothetical protein FNH13_01790 [Ornithinimicrobium ciconiae]|uniref:Peptidoglycan binding-like domain-containing protein n=1 Tax=Ornithinimicrobium ciconiae TaxID=2594265 RepID=A0A516G6V9_9MICO|nr:peptidoglycan-binding protein [Ornithinimicrobium ciconiae]QDO87212.1 hypothetical protein FNH13_01790 [Ornithinimicrobium ciconiae]
MAVLGAALAISLVQLPAWATDGETDAGTGDGGTTEPAAPADETQPADGSGSDGSGSNGSGDSDTTPPATGGSKSGGGTKYGGRATGPAPLITLPDDPNYPVPEPPENEFLPEGVELPEEIDASNVFQRNVICDPVTKPGVIAVANLLSQSFENQGYTLHRNCIDLRSEHYDGRAVDWQLSAYDPQERRTGDAVVTWLTDDDGEIARRLGIQSIIWNKRSWHASTGYWQGYAGKSDHTDHIHLSFTWDGAFMRTSWWTGVALTEEEADQGPCSVIGGAYAAVPQARRTEVCVPAEVWPTNTGYTTVRPGGQGAGVELVQPLLEVEQTGVLDTETREALIAWQTEQGIPQTGVLDQLTYAAALGQELPELPEQALAVELPDYRVTEFSPFKRTVVTEGDRGEAVAALQKALGVEDDGIFGPKTAEALTAFAEEEPLVLDDLTATDTLVWHLLEQRAYPYLAYRDIEVQIEDTGLPVTLIQQLLELEDDGIFGPVTQQGVMEAQAAAELEQTGIVDGATWQAIEAAAAQEEASADESAEEESAQDNADTDHAQARVTQANNAQDRAQADKAQAADTQAPDTQAGDAQVATSQTLPAAVKR